MTSAAGAAASASTDGHRSSQACQRGTTRSTCVCWSITSLTRIAYGSRVCRHGRSRPFAAYHSDNRASTRARLRDTTARGGTHDADGLPGAAVRDEPVGLLRPDGALRQLHAQALAGALAHGGAHADLDGDHGAERRRG